MTFQPIVPLSGYAGWSFLNRTMDVQKAAFNEAASVQRATDYFRENIGAVASADDLMSDRRLLSVALGAFGLEEDINNTFFVQKVLEDGIVDDDALANKLSDKRYFEFSKAFGFGDFDTPNTELSTFPDEIITKYQDTQFEIAVGEQDETMRLALNLDRELIEIANTQTSDNGLWYGVMGNSAVRSVFETALGLPSSVGSLDLDQQLSEFRDKTSRYFDDSEVSQFADKSKREELVRLFLVRSEVAAGSVGASPLENALSLLSGFA
ncbi:uncharacterized protein DUF1217 [Pacificibacter maritimus]|uniref:Uncharacterized protein DUF1217 n=1 Tax=Pacificibacter maritimus TaxID=762213 RepID=A0A3N4U8G2_9RHOB|nr:DUF1217 domain-containing protein [Pacificibacter maritimus]RPE64635.1 uncharacterized protein DUF1217 [Pacificibacter maritimus]